MDDEVTRIESVGYLSGVSGHGVVSTLFLVLAGGLAWTDNTGPATMATIIAYGISINGLSIYLWDRLRASVRTRTERRDAGSTRTLQPHRLSPETKAELAAGLIMVGGFAVLCVAALVAVRSFTTRYVVALAIGVLGVGNVGALGWAYRSSESG